MKKALLSALLTIFLPVMAMASVPISTHWQPAGAGGNGAYVAAYWDKDIEGRAYLLSDVAGFFISEDGAQTWRASNAGQYLCSEGNSLDQVGDKLLMVCNQGSFVSQDRGETWAYVGTPDSVKYYGNVGAIKHSDTDTMYVGDDSGDVNYTTDNGANWSKLEVDAIYGSAINSVLLTQDDRYLFVTAVRASDPGIKVYDLLSDPAGGDYETYTLSGTRGTYNYEMKSYVDGSDVEHVCVTAGYNIACTVDGGQSWTRTADFASGPYETVRRFDVAYDENTGEARFFASHRTYTTYSGCSSINWCNNGKHYSTDSGASWTDLGQGSQTLDYSASPGDKAAGSDGETVNNNYAMHYYDINPFDVNEYLTVDTWNVGLATSFASAPKSVSKGAQNVVITDMEHAPNGWMFVSGMDFGVWVTRDYGSTWESLLYDTDAGRGYTDGYGGHTWQLELLGSETDWYAGDGIVIGTFSAWDTVGSSYANAPYVVRSTDNGDTWSKSVFGPTRCTWEAGLGWSVGSSCHSGADNGFPKGFDCADNGTCYIAQAGYQEYSSGTGRGGLFKSTDSGASWSRMSGGLNSMSTSGNWGRSLAVDPADETGNTFAFFPYRTGFTQAECSWESPCRATDGATCACFGTISHNPSGYGEALGVYYPPSGSIAYITSWGQIWRSSGWDWFSALEYANQNWQNPWGGGDVQAMAWNPANPSEAVVGQDPADNEGATIWWTLNINASQPVQWVDITGDLAIESKVTAAVFVPEEGDNGYLWIATGGSGVWKLDLGEVYNSKLNNVDLRNVSIR